MSDEPRAVFADGVLYDPAAIAIIRALSEINCRKIVAETKERLVHFAERVRVRGLSPKDVVLVLIDVDDLRGQPIAKALLPDEDWGKMREKGLAPYARGIAYRGGIEDAIGDFDPAGKAALVAIEGLAIVVVHGGIAACFEAAKELG